MCLHTLRGREIMRRTATELGKRGVVMGGLRSRVAILLALGLSVSALTQPVEAESPSSAASGLPLVGGVSQAADDAAVPAPVDGPIVAPPPMPEPVVSESRDLSTVDASEVTVPIVDSARRDDGVLADVEMSVVPGPGEPVSLGEVSLSLSLGDGSLLERAGVDVSGVDTSVSDATVRVVEMPVSESVERDSSRSDSDVVSFQLTTPDPEQRSVVRAELDYSAMVGLHSMDWPSRLQVLQYPACVLTTPDVDGCSVGVPVSFENDQESRTLVAEVVVGDPSAVPVAADAVGDDEAVVVAEPGLAEPVGSVVPGFWEAILPKRDPGAEREMSGEPEGLVRSDGDRRVADRRDGVGGALRSGTSGDVVYGLSAGYSSEFGSFVATPGLTTSSWSVGLQSGSFQWAYDVATAPVAMGAAPDFSVGYQSGAVDGLAPHVNTQSGLWGHGWSSSLDGYIERSYRACSTDNPVTGWASISDLCWFTDSAGVYEHLSVVLNGTSSELVAIGANEWRLEFDPGWRVLRKFAAAGSPDDNGEYFELTVPDGTVYSFGSTPSRESIWYVPVFANHSNEPCYNSVKIWSHCDQAWRWNVDQVVDTNTNLTTYQYRQELNNYGRFGHNNDVSTYVRGGYLESVAYGANINLGIGARGLLQFSIRERCFSTTPSDNCQWNGGNPTPWFPDAPLDLGCATGRCLKHAPSFWTMKSLEGVTSFYWNNSGWYAADTTKFIIEWEDVNLGLAHAQMWMREIQRTGAATAGGLPAPVTFDPVRFESYNSLLDNRADGVTQEYWRVDWIRDEAGAVTSITYGQPHGGNGTCTQPTQGWMVNEQDCYPHQTINGTAVGFGAFNKYLVTQVKRIDVATTNPTTDGATINASPEQTWVYAYQDAPAWRWDYDEINVDRTYYDWRGHSQVGVYSGGGSYTKHYLHRGMYGAYRGGFLPARTDQFTSNGVTIQDHNSLSGREYQVDHWTGSTASFEFMTYGIVQPWPGVWWTSSDLTTTAVYDTTTSSWKYTKTDADIDGYGNVWFLKEHGDQYGSASDDRCTQNLYTPNTTTWVVSKPYAQKVFSNVYCDVFYSARYMFYDGAAIGVAPVRGNLTKTQVDTGTESLISQTAYDNGGRPTSTDGPRSDVTDITTFTYDPTSAYTKTVTNALGHATTTTAMDLAHMLPLTVTDANGKATNYRYDSVGRLRAVYTAGDPVAGTPSVAFDYSVSSTTGTSVRTRIARNATESVDSWVFYDGLGQQIQFQRLSPTGGTILSATEYDERGLAIRQVPEYFDSVDAPGRRRLNAGSGDRQTTMAYDPMGRPATRREFDYNTQRYQEDYAYSGFATTTTSSYSEPRTTVVTAYGQTESTTRTLGGVGYTTGYEYDTVGNMVRMTDPLGNRTDSTWDRAGRMLTHDDPDQGLTTYSYRPDSTIEWSKDATNVLISYSVDALGRNTHVWKGSTLLEKYDYDKAGELGLLNYAASYYQGKEVKVATLGYDARDRPTGVKYTIPSIPGITAGTGLDGSYTFTTAQYDRANNPLTVGYPAFGTMAAETVTTGYDNIGQPTTLIGARNHVGATSYAFDGIMSERIYDGTTAATPGAVTETIGWNRGIDRPATTTRTRNGVVLQEDRHQWDAVNNLTSVSHDRVGTAEDHTECFEFDTWSRLTRAYTNNTVGATANCAPGPGAGGPAPYDSTYGYTPIDNFTTGPGGQAFTYPASGPTGVRPHAPSTAGSTGFVWNNDGTLKTRQQGAVTTSYGWDPLNRLSTVTTGGVVNTNVYAPGGQRIIAKDATGVHLYLGNYAERHASGGVTTNKRMYAIGGQAVAIGTKLSTASSGTAPTYDYVFGDIRGSATLSTRTGTATTSAQWYTPYGDQRGTSNIPATTRGYIGQHEDTTGLNYLNNRHYDPTTGTFLSVDPLVTVTGEPYIYGGANPVTYSDPTGLDFECPVDDSICGLSPQDAVDAGIAVPSSSVCGTKTLSSCRTTDKTKKTTSKTFAGGYIAGTPIIHVPVPEAAEGAAIAASVVFLPIATEIATPSAIECLVYWTLCSTALAAGGTVLGNVGNDWANGAPLGPVGVTSGASVTDDIIRQYMSRSPLRTQQTSVDIGLVRRYVDDLLEGAQFPSIKVDDGIVVQGNHRYIASLLTGIDIPFTEWVGGRPDRVVPWSEVTTYGG